MKFKITQSISEQTGIAAKVNINAAKLEFAKAAEDLGGVATKAIPKINEVIMALSLNQPAVYSVDINWLEEMIGGQRLSATIVVAGKFKFTANNARTVSDELYHTRGLPIITNVVSDSGQLRITLVNA